MWMHMLGMLLTEEERCHVQQNEPLRIALNQEAQTAFQALVQLASGDTRIPAALHERLQQGHLLDFGGGVRAELVQALEASFTITQPETHVLELVRKTEAQHIGRGGPGA